MNRELADGPGARFAVELALFAGLAAFGLVQWARLFSEPPVLRLALVGVLACAAAAAVGLVAQRVGRLTARVVAIGLALATAAAGLLLVGLAPRLLAPSGWAELAGGFGTGLDELEEMPLPIAAGDSWLRLTLLAGAPLLLGLAAAAAFWPSQRTGRRRVLGLAVLLSLYTIAVTLDSPGSEYLWGIPLLFLAVAWLWLPELAAGRAALALAVTALAAACALPVAARVDPARPWWNYQEWNLFAAAATVSFNWDHSYGPLDWPQRGTTLLEVRAEQALYWKASVLDRFDGFVWQRASRSDALAFAEVAARRGGPNAAELAERHPEWRLEASFDVQGLLSGLVIGAGTPLAVEGVEGATRTADGTVIAGDTTLTEGEQYSITTYSPQPSARRLRAVPSGYPDRRFGAATLVGLPAAIPGVGEPSGSYAPSAAITIPGWGRPPRGEVREALLSSPYAGAYRLARRLTAGAPTAYDAVRSVERYLHDGDFDYSPNVDQHTYPLSAFLFEDRAGYCQQFAGSMALMLRLVGIPSRVVSGFAPGRFDRERGAYVVSDTDAHSWVEVYFRGIGWVAFDPTPSAAPAASQRFESGGPLVLRRDGTATTQSRGRTDDIEAALEGGTVGGAAADDGIGALAWAGTALAALALVAGSVGIARWRRRHRAMRSPEAAELQSAELVRALRRLGWELPRDVTLLEIERRFERAGRRMIATYAGALRRHRFAAPGSPPPGPAERRGLRRALLEGGLGRRLRVLAALPPGGPEIR